MTTVRRACALSIPFLLAASAASADDIADFYRGKQMQIIVRSAAGSSYDQYSRLLARYIVRHIPGNPTMIAVNMTGGGGIKATNFIADVAAKDGTILTIVNQGAPMDQALSLNNQMQADLRQFNWIGNMSDSNQILVTWHTSQTKTLADAKRRETPIGATGAGAPGVQLPAVYNNILGTKFKIITGYSGPEINLAMERGEIDGRGTNTWASYVSATPYVANKQINIIIQTGTHKETELPDVPLLSELGTTPEETAVLQFVSKSVAVGRPIAAPPGVPSARVAALRKAFYDTLHDPVFMAEADKEKVEIHYMSGEDLARIVADLIEAPPAIREKARLAMEPKSLQQLPGTKAGGGD